MRQLGIASSPTIRWGKPFVYGDVSKKKPYSFQSVAPGRDIIGIVAFNSMTLPKINEVEQSLQPGQVAYFLGESSLTYQSCSGGCGIIFTLNGS